MEQSGLYTKGEEVFSSVTHGTGAVLAIAGMGALITLAAVFSDAVSVASCAVYGLTLVLLFTMSTLYHAIPFPRAKSILRVLDHGSIYLLIAGTYTPIILVAARASPRALPILVSVWALAALGIALNAIDLQRFKKQGLLLYVLMGWAVLLDVRAVLSGLGRLGSAFLLSGGVGYTVGIVFYQLKKIRYMHGVWHLFVLASGVLHYLCIVSAVLSHR